MGDGPNPSPPDVLIQGSQVAKYQVPSTQTKGVVGNRAVQAGATCSLSGEVTPLSEASPAIHPGADRGLGDAASSSSGRNSHSHAKHEWKKLCLATSATGRGPSLTP